MKLSRAVVVLQSAPDIPERTESARKGEEPYKIAILHAKKPMVQDNRSTSRLARDNEVGGHSFVRGDEDTGKNEIR